MRKGFDPESAIEEQEDREFASSLGAVRKLYAAKNKALSTGRASSEGTLSAEELAKMFHDIYEQLAPKFGYKTREESAVPWDQVPENNKQLMVAVCAMILGK
jgi:hypothetical protein